MTLARPRTATGLDDLLAVAREDSAEFPYLLANHAPMVLTALAGLGSDEARLGAFDAAYRAANALVPAPAPVRAIEGGRWTEALGDRSRETDLRRHFTKAIERDGLRATVADALPSLVPGIGASALHALMRLAYGVMRGDGAETGAALGYWAATYLPLAAPTGAPPVTHDPAEVLAGVAALPALRAVEPETDLLWHAMRAVGEAPAFAPVIDWLAIDETTPARLAATALRLFAGVNDFTSLHAVTGMHWVRLVLPYAPRPDLLLRHFWQCIAALVPKLGCPALPDELALARMRQSPCPEWPAIAAAAVRSDDEHDISLVFSAREEEAVFGDRLYRVVAARRMGLIG